LTQTLNPVMSLCCMALVVLERANLPSNSCKSLRPRTGMLEWISVSYNLLNTINSFSEIFYVDATNEQTLQADLKAITPGSAEWSVDATCHWLASQGGKTWLLYFDNADDMELDLGRFIPSFGNTLITTRNSHLCIHADEDADSRVGGMDCEESKTLLLHLSRVERSEENKKLAELIVEVCF